MRSYLILTPPGGAERDHRSTLFLKDGFSWGAFFFPWIWLLWHRLWLAGLAALAIQLISGFLLGRPDLAFAGGLLGLALNVLVGLEGRHHQSESLIKRGWTLEAVLTAPDLKTAEEMYFSNLPASAMPTPQPSEWARSATQPVASPDRLGLFDYGGR